VTISQLIAEGIYIFHSFNKFLGSDGGILLSVSFEFFLFLFIAYMATSQYLKAKNRQIKYLSISFLVLALTKGIVGDDSNGDTILSHLKTEKVKFIGKRKKGLSGYSVILVSLHHDRSILVYKGVNNLLSVKDFKMNSLCPKWFYMSSLMGVGFQTTKKIALYAKKNNIPFAFNPSMYLAKYGLSKLSSLVSGCSLLVLNLEEANALCSTRNKTALQVIKILSTSTHRVVITDGANGATGFDGKIVYILHATKCKNVESTGAGDAMATGIVAGLIKGKSFDYSLRLGYAQSTSVIGYVGAKAGLLSYSKLISRVKKQKIKVLKKPLK